MQHLCWLLLLMSERKIFFQDFLFEGMPVDKQDYPVVNIQFSPPDLNFDSYLTISFDTLLRMNKREEWELLFEKTKNNNVCILDDVPLANTEIEKYKMFYLSAYYYCLSKKSKSVICKKQ